MICRAIRQSLSSLVLLTGSSADHSSKLGLVRPHVSSVRLVFLTSVIDVYGVELILTGVLQQNLDYSSYPFLLAISILYFYISLSFLSGQLLFDSLTVRTNRIHSC